MERYSVRWPDPDRRAAEPARPETGEHIRQRMANLRACLVAETRAARLALLARGSGAAVLVAGIVFTHAVPVALALVAAFGVAYAGHTALRRRQAESLASRTDRAIRALASEPDARVVGLLADAYRHGDELTRRSLVAILRDLLPQLRAADLICLSATEVDAILGLLHETNLVLAALPAVGRLAPVGAMADVLRLLSDAYGVLGLRETNERVPDRFMDKVRVEANRCVMALKAAEAAEQQRTTLVRAAQGPGGTLVRPAGPTDSVPDQLLRPAEPL